MSPIVPIVIGAALAFGGGALTEWLRDRRASDRARDDRREARQERRDDLQRETMIELQDAVQRYVRAVGAIVHFDEMARRERETKTLVPDEMDGELHASQVLTLKLATRVRDEELRAWVKEMVAEGTSAVFTHTDRADEHQFAMGRLSESVQERLGGYIRDL